MQLYIDFNPMVSVILPTFNRADYLPRAVKSVINQNFKDWELIIVDDGSWDNTYAVIEPFISENENIRYMKHSNRKVTLTMNAGLQASLGEYVTFLGSDDEYKDDHISLRMNYLRKNPDVDIIHGGVDIRGDEYVQDKNDLTKKIHLSECIIGGTLVGKRNSFLDLNGFNNLVYSGESDLYERAVEIYNIEKVSWATYIYHRDTPDSICNNIIKEN